MAPRAALLLLAAALLIAAPAVRASGKRRLAFVEVSVRIGLVGRPRAACGQTGGRTAHASPADQQGRTLGARGGAGACHGPSAWVEAGA